MIYTLVGTETYLVEQTLKKLLAEKIPSTLRDFNFDTFEGSECDARKIIESAQTLPMMAEKRGVLVRHADQIKKAGLDLLAEFLPKCPDSVELFFVAEKSDKRLPFWKTLYDMGRVREFKPIEPRSVGPWIEEELKKKEYRIDSKAVHWMVTTLGNDLATLSFAIEKLILFKGAQKEIVLADAESCFSGFSWKSVFDLTESVGRKDLGRSLRLFKRMISSGESPVALLAIIARHFRILTKVKDGDVSGIPPFFLRDYQAQAGQFSRERLFEKMESLFQADWALKSSPIASSIQFENLLIELCR